jgi:disulfide bond formation protein DsbB
MRQVKLPEFSPEQLAVMLGTLSLALIAGALLFEYVGGMAPCHLCMWQRYPHYAAIVMGLGGGAAIWLGKGPRWAGLAVAVVTAGLVAASGLIGIYHAGVEWHLWTGPTSCTGNAFRFTGTLDLNETGPMCDVAAWRLFGISMAGYNALISLGAVGLAGLIFARAPAARRK